MPKQYKNPSRLSWWVACLFRLRSLGARKTYNLISPALMKTSPAIGFQQAKRRRRNKKEISEQKSRVHKSRDCFHGSCKAWETGRMVVWLCVCGQRERVSIRERPPAGIQIMPGKARKSTHHCEQPKRIITATTYTYKRIVTGSNIALLLFTPPNLRKYGRLAGPYLPILGIFSIKFADARKY